jgi:hypothetical protein
VAVGVVLLLLQDKGVLVVLAAAVLEVVLLLGQQWVHLALHLLAGVVVGREPVDQVDQAAQES